MKLVHLAIVLLLIPACAKSDATVENKSAPAVVSGSGDVQFATHSAGATDQHNENTLDTRISVQVQQTLLDDKTTGPDAKAIRVKSVDGAVTLLGFASTEAVKNRATILAKAVGSVVKVDNQIAVDPEAVKNGQPIESPVDRMMSDRVRTALLEDRTTAGEASAVSVVTQDGVVHLTGQVSSEDVRTRMNIVAKAVGSVKSVVNELMVKAL